MDTNYREVQIKHMSHEYENRKWVEGQQRFVNYAFKNVDRDSQILDIGCGDGFGIKFLLQLGFHDIAGMEFNPAKAHIAKKYDVPILEADMHDVFGLNHYDIVYSSHSLEHCHSPGTVLRNIHMSLKPKGQMFLVLPYPDLEEGNGHVHVGKEVLGTNIDDAGNTLTEFVKAHKFKIEEKAFDHYREPEIWLFCRKV